MILIGLGANLPGPAGTPVETLEAALNMLARRRIRVLKRSSWLVSPPVDGSNQPNYLNGVALVATGHSPHRLLDVLHEIEAELGRARSIRWAPRCLDLDLLDYHGLTVTAGASKSGFPPNRTLALPHPEISRRHFVLRPISQIAPGWRHPVNGMTSFQLLAHLDPDRRVKPTQNLSRP